MPARTPSSPVLSLRLAVRGQARWTLAALPAILLPLLFLHVDYQPGLALRLGSARAHVVLSDVAVLAIALAALAAGLRAGFAPLRRSWPVWTAGASLIALTFVATGYGRAQSAAYPVGTHLVTAGKFAEYAALGLALPLLFRRRADLDLLFAAVVLWSALATLVGLVQFFGWDIAGGWGTGHRQPSFLGQPDFAALSGGTLALGLAAVAFGASTQRERALARRAGVAGGVGLVLAGALAGVIGLGAAALAAGLLAWRRRILSVRRAGALAAIGALVAAGVLVLRGGDFEQFLRFVGLQPTEAATRRNVQTYAQHTVLTYIGLRIFLDHPVLGVGWQASAEEHAYGPYLAAAHRRFPNAPALAFPSPAHPYGVQNAYVQALADLGLIGFALFVGLLVTGLALGARAALRAPPERLTPAVAGVLWLLVAAGVWSGLGLVAGIPLDALVWLALGLVALAAAEIGRRA